MLIDATSHLLGFKIPYAKIFGRQITLDFRQSKTIANPAGLRLSYGQSNRVGQNARLMAVRSVWMLPPSLRISLIHPSKSFSILSRPAPNYEGHVPLNALGKGALAAGSAVISLLNPKRAGTFLL